MNCKSIHINEDTVEYLPLWAPNPAQDEAGSRESEETSSSVIIIDGDDESSSDGVIVIEL